MDGKKRSIHLSIVKKTSISPAAFVEIINYKIEGTYNEYLMCRICKLYIFKSSIWTMTGSLLATFGFTPEIS